MAKMHIHQKLTVEPKKLTVEYLDNQNDLIQKKVFLGGVRKEILQSHIDAIYETVIKDAEDQSQELSKQDTLFDEGIEEGEAQSHKADDPTDFSGSTDQGEEVDFSLIKVPACPDTDIPDFNAMTSDHCKWYIENHYTGEDGEPGANELCEDIQFVLNERISKRSKLANAKKKALELLNR